MLGVNLDSFIRRLKERLVYQLSDAFAQKLVLK